jgi:hypothetical protein
MVLVGAGVCGLVMATLAASLMALLRAQSLATAADGRTRGADEDRQVGLEDVHRRLEALAARIEEVRTVPPAVAAQPARPGMNLSRRSEALRRHRRGESAGYIAQHLGLPIQEVELLIKVHEIVMSTV